MKIKSIPTFLIAFVALTRLSALAADDLPKPQSFARYEGMMNRSPFAVATAAVPPPQAPNFAKDLYIANAARLPDEGVATLNSSVDKILKEYVSTKGPNKNGYSIANFEWSDRVGATKVTIAKDGQSATLTFNQALLSQAAPNAPLPTQPQVNLQQTQPTQPQQALPQGGQALAPAVPLPNINAMKPAPVPMLPTPPPRVRGVIPRPNSNPNPAAAQSEQSSLTDQ